MAAPVCSQVNGYCNDKGFVHIRQINEKGLSTAPFFVVLLHLDILGANLGNYG